MGEFYYVLLMEHKKGFYNYYVNKNVEGLLLNVKAEFIHIYPYTTDFILEVEKFEKFVLDAEKLIYSQSFSGSMGERQRMFNNTKALTLLFEAQKILVLIEASKGMLQPKNEDPIKKMRKYGD